MDEAIRQKFQDFKPAPPQSVWEKVKPEIGPGGGTSGGPVSLPIIITGGILFFVASFLLNFSFNEEILSVSPERIKQDLLIAQNSAPTGMVDINQNEQPSFSDFEMNGYVPNINTTPANTTISEVSETDIIKVRVSEYDHNFFEKNKAFKGLVKNTSPFYKEPDRSQIFNNTFRMDIYTLDLESMFRKSGSDQTIHDLFSPVSRDVASNQANDDYRREPGKHWAIGLYFSPDWTFYPQDTLPTVPAYALDFNVYYQFSDYFVQSGIGIKSKSDNGNYGIDYNQYLGSYEDVYNVTFDSTDQGIIPTYHTSTVEVYDSLDHFKIKETSLKYTYLEVPLLFGYQKNIGKLNYFFKGGANVSFLVNKKIPDAQDPGEKIQIINVDQQVPSRISMNWQLFVSAGIGYSITDRVSLNIEPTFRYYMSPEYENTIINTKNPYSIGLRAGVIYKLNK